jgi:hypothetical protein
MFRERISCHGRFWKGLGYSEDAVRMVNGIFGFLKELLKVQKLVFRIVSPKIVSELN